MKNLSKNRKINPAPSNGVLDPAGRVIVPSNPRSRLCCFRRRGGIKVLVAIMITAGILSFNLLYASEIGTVNQGQTASAINSNPFLNSGILQNSLKIQEEAHFKYIIKREQIQRDRLISKDNN